MHAIDPGITELFDSLSRHYGAKDFAAVRALWVEGLPRPFYLAEEHDQIMDSWDKVENYWRLTSQSLTHLRARFVPRSSVPLDAVLQLVGFELAWIASVGSEAPLAGTLRAAAVCERRPAGWRLRAWIEAPLAPIVYVRQLYQRVARELSVDGAGREFKD